MSPFRSLYWRIALACMVLLLAALLVQSGVVVAGLAQGGGLPGRQAAQRFAEVVAADLTRELDARPDVPLERLVAERYRTLYRPVLFVTPDGRVLGGWRGRGGPGLARRYAARQIDQGRGKAPGPEGVAEVRARGRVMGNVVVLPRRPVASVAEEIGPLTLLGALTLALVGAALVAWVTFGPAHRRLRALEAAAERLGGGDLSARAPAEGHDEIAQVAAAFNRTADALQAEIDRVRSEQALRRQLLADVSHELHTPLTAIRGYVDTLQMREIPLTDEQRTRYLAIVSEETARLERLIADLLDLARLDAGGLVMHVAPVPLTPLLLRVLDRFTPAAAARAITLDLDIGDLSDATVSGDAGRLEQALSNLVGNALRFSEDSSRVRVSARRGHGVVVLGVRDQGPGLTPDQQTRVFERFYKTDPSRSADGSGLGLSIVKAIVEAHGGHVSVESALGQGSTFYLHLPAGTVGALPPVA
jgi:two-component system, OmpR family, sensor kinase